MNNRAIQIPGFQTTNASAIVPYPGDALKIRKGTSTIAKLIPIEVNRRRTENLVIAA